MKADAVPGSAAQTRVVKVEGRACKFIWLGRCDFMRIATDRQRRIEVGH
jgi:hypothetical protein